MRNFGAFIREKRLERGLKQADIAEGLCSINTISRIENGDQMPTAYVFMYALERMGVSGFSYGDFFEPASLYELKLRCRIMRCMEERRLNVLPELLMDYSDNCYYENGEMSKQFFHINKALYLYFETGDASELASEAAAALSLTWKAYEKELFGWGRGKFCERFLTQTELACANALAAGLVFGGEPDRAVGIINKLIVSATLADTCLPIYFRNLSALFNNAAVAEERTFPDESNDHICEASKYAGKGAGALIQAKILKNKAMITRDNMSVVMYKLLRSYYRLPRELFGEDRFLYVF